LHRRFVDQSPGTAVDVDRIPPRELLAILMANYPNLEVRSHNRACIPQTLGHYRQWFGVLQIQGEFTRLDHEIAGCFSPLSPTHSLSFSVSLSKQFGVLRQYLRMYEFSRFGRSEVPELAHSKFVRKLFNMLTLIDARRDAEDDA